MSDLTKIIKIFLWSLSPFFVTPYIIKDDQAQANFIQKCLSILVLNLSAIYFFYKHAFILKQPDLDTNSYSFLGYLRSLFLCTNTLLISIIISKNHEKFAKSVSKLLKLAKKLNVQPVKKFKIFSAFQIFFVYTTTISLFGVNFLKTNTALGHGVCYRIIQAYLSIFTMLGTLIGQAYFFNLIIILYYCTNAIHKKLKKFKAPKFSLFEDS